MAKLTSGDSSTRGGAARQRGFTLIELMIVVVIVAILVGIAVPAYQDYVKRARRSDAQSALTGLAAVVERYYSDSNTYVGAENIIGSGTAALYPDWAPVDAPRDDRAYRLQILNNDTTSYTLRATPENLQIMQDDGYLELTHTGARRWDRDDSGGIGADENTWETD